MLIGSLTNHTLNKLKANLNNKHSQNTKSIIEKLQMRLLILEEIEYIW